MPIPYSYGLVIGAGKDPWELVVKENRSDIVQVAIQGKETPPGLIRPDFDFVIISTRNKKRLGLMEVDTSDGPVVLLESIYQGSHAVIP